LTRDELYKQVYFSNELRKGAKYLLREFPSYSELHEDLLSDSILEVFKKTDEQLIDLHERNKLHAYIYFSMRNVIYKGANSRTFRNYGLENNISNEFDFDVLESDSVDIDSVEITKDEHEYSEKLFGCTTKLNIQFMRQIEIADSNKESDIAKWESAQVAKLYFEFKSYRKIVKATGMGYQYLREQMQKFMSNITDKKMNVTVVTKKLEPVSGMELYRLHYPYFNGIHQNHSGDMTIKRMTYEYIEQQPSGGLEDDVYVFSRLSDTTVANKVIDSGAKLVIDIDDYWNLPLEHPMRESPMNKIYVKNITTILPMAHLVTCTTPMLADKLKYELGIDAVIIKNTIPDGLTQFSTDKFSHSKVRFLYMGGVHHMEDLRLMEDGMKKLFKDISLRNKFQIILGGYNPNPHFTEYEKILTDEYRNLGNGESDYIEYLKLNTQALDHISFNKPYRRLWAQPVDKYGQGYKEGDVALIPLLSKQKNGKDNDFASCKSELKIVEAGSTGCAAIVSDVLPYSPYLEHEKNCFKINPKTNDWFKYIRILANDKELRMELTNNLSKTIKKEFSHKVETGKLFNALKKLKR